MKRKKVNDSLIITYKSVTGKVLTETFDDVMYLFGIGKYVYVDTRHGHYYFKEKSIISILRNEITRISL